MGDSSAATEPMKLTVEQAIDRLGTGAFQRRLLISAGLCSASDAMEVLLLSFLAVVVQFEFDVSPQKGSLVTSIVFIGAMVGTIILGPLGDKLGRKPMFLVASSIISLAGLLTATAQNYWTMVALRFFVGFGLGGIVIPYDTLSEFLPAVDRGHYLLRMGYFWTIGTMAVPALAYFALDKENSWRIFVLLCSIPCILSTLLAIVWVPESPRWLVSQGKPDKALEILRKGAIINGKNPEELFPDGVHFIPESNEEDQLHSLFCLFKPEWIRLTLCIWAVWIGKSFMYWGTIQIITLVFTGTTADESAGSYNFDYAAIFSSSVAELVGVSLALLLVDRTGRTATQSVLYLFGGGMVFGLCWIAGANGTRQDERAPLVALAFLARMCVMGAAQLTWCQTAELFPTQVRNTGHAAASAVARIGGASTPWLASMDNSFQIMAIAMACISIYTSLMVCMLPETKGLGLGTARMASGSFDPDGKPIKVSEIL